MKLEASQIHKSFGGIKALKGVNFFVESGEALALVGENGAGKSTLMKVLSGVYPAGQFEGEIKIDGRSFHFANTKDAEAQGIAIIHQELNLFPDLTVGENIFLSHLPKKGRAPQFLAPVDFKTIEVEANALLKILGVNFLASTRLGDLTTGQQQMVEIAKALSLNAKILILDEPTSSLSDKEVHALFAVLNELKSKGLGLIYISHKMEEVFTLCDRVSILRDGQSVFTGLMKQTTPGQIISHMVGRELKELYPPKKKRSTNRNKDAPAFSVRNFKAFKKSEGKMRVKDVSLDAYRGEILGISGLMGAGRTDFLLGIFQFSNYLVEGEISLDGKIFSGKNPREAKDFGLALVTEDRKKNGLHLDFSIKENMALAALGRMVKKSPLKTIDYDRIEALVVELQKRLKIKMGNANNPVRSLSGGNQQKVAIGKWLATSPKVLFLDEPTRGIDVGAKFEIYSLLNQLVDEGLCVIMASSELPEVIGLCDRVVVMREGHFVATLEGDDINEQKIMRYAVGADQPNKLPSNQNLH